MLSDGTSVIKVELEQYLRYSGPTSSPTSYSVSWKEHFCFLSEKVSGYQLTKVNWLPLCVTLAKSQ